MNKLKQFLFFSCCFLSIQISCQQKVASELSTKLPEGSRLDAGKLVDDFNCVECNAVEQKVKRAVEGKPSLSLSPDQYDSWETCLAQNPQVKVFLLEPGDYNAWGTLKIQQRSNLVFSASNYSTLLKKQATNHPANQREAQQVRLKNFILTFCKDITLLGLSFAGNDFHKAINRYGGWQNKIEGGGDNCIFQCSVKDVYRGSGIRLRNTNNNVIIHSVFEQSHPSFTGDHVAIYISALEGQVSRGNQMLNNEIRNWNDGFMLGYSRQKKKKAKSKAQHQIGECPATLFAYNSIYLTSDFYGKNGLTAFAENGIDLKSGTSSEKAEDKIRIAKNKIWGFRPSEKKWASGSEGAGITLHVNASNIDISDNFIFDVPVGISIRSNSKKYVGAKTENIRIQNNFFSNIQQIAGKAGSGTGIICNTGKVAVKNNVFLSVKALSKIQKQKKFVEIENNYFSTTFGKEKRLDQQIQQTKWISSNRPQ